VTAAARGVFTVNSFDSEQYDDADGTKLGRARILKTFTGDLEGESSVEMLFATPSDERLGVYVAIERVDAALHGRKGSFVLRHDGIRDGDRQSLSVIVVPGSGTSGLLGLSGELAIDIDADGTHHYRFDYKISDGE
jgi:uncharacterized protein DUF3224